MRALQADIQQEGRSKMTSTNTIFVFIYPSDLVLETIRGRRCEVTHVTNWFSETEGDVTVRIARHTEVTLPKSEVSFSRRS